MPSPSAGSPPPSSNSSNQKASQPTRTLRPRNRTQKKNAVTYRRVQKRGQFEGEESLITEDPHTIICVWRSAGLRQHSLRRLYLGRLETKRILELALLVLLEELLDADERRRLKRLNDLRRKGGLEISSDQAVQSWKLVSTHLKRHIQHQMLCLRDNYGIQFAPEQDLKCHLWKSHRITIQQNPLSHNSVLNIPMVGDLRMNSIRKIIAKLTPGLRVEVLTLCGLTIWL